MPRFKTKSWDWEQSKSHYHPSKNMSQHPTKLYLKDSRVHQKLPTTITTQCKREILILRWLQWCIRTWSILTSMREHQTPISTCGEVQGKSIKAKKITRFWKRIFNNPKRSKLFTWSHIICAIHAQSKCKPLAKSKVKFKRRPSRTIVLSGSTRVTQTCITLPQHDPTLKNSPTNQVSWLRRQSQPRCSWFNSSHSLGVSSSQR